MASRAPAAVADQRPTPGRIQPADLRHAFSSVAYDYTPVGSIDELSDIAAAVVSGELEDVVVGRLEGAAEEADPFAARNAALKVTVTECSQGDIRVGESIWIEIPVEAAQLEDVLPVGLRMTAFLVPARPSAPGYPYSLDGSEIPEDASLWSVAHAQGLTFQLTRLAEGRTQDFEPLTGAWQRLPRD